MGRLIVFSGAGLSAESGLSTFRSEDGLWSRYSIERVCDIRTWRQNFTEVHEFYNMRRAEIGRAQPNVAHQQIAAWTKEFETIVITQNIDDLLERAGCADVVHLHGRASEMYCYACGTVWDIGYAAWGPEDRCVCGCRKGVKPNVVFFGQEAPLYRTLHTLLDTLNDTDTFVVTGTSGLVVAIDDQLFGRQGFKIYNDLEAPRLSRVYDELLLVPATKAMPLIDAMLRSAVPRPVIR